MIFRGFRRFREFRGIDLADYPAKFGDHGFLEEEILSFQFVTWLHVTT